MANKPRKGFPRAIVVIAVLSLVFIIRHWFFPDETTFWYANGEKQAQGMMVKGKEIGKWTYWYENGQIESTQYYDEGVADSIWVWNFPDGSMKKQGRYEGGKGEGEWTFYHENGQVKSRGIFRADVMTGEWKEWYDNGQLKSVGPYENGLRDGKWTFYHRNGNLESNGMLQAGERSGEWVYFYENGRKKQELVHNGEAISLKSAWSPDGDLMIQEGAGTLTEYYPDGTKSAETVFENGQKRGAYTAYYEDGSRKETGRNTEAGYIIQQFWDRKGKALVQNGTGSLVFTFPNGKTGREGRYENGLKTGLWKTFDEEGNPYLLSHFKEGKLHGEFVQYHPNGNVYSKGNMVNDQKEGRWFWFWPNGKKQTEVVFENGAKVGTQKYWAETGQLMEEENHGEPASK